MIVVAGVLRDERGRVLITQRPVGKPLAGRWEFPGGKLHDGESPRAALVRELREELALDVLEAEPYLRYDVAQPGRVVTLDFWTVTRWSGVVTALEGQAWKWVAAQALPAEDILEADARVVKLLAAPSPAAVR